MIEFGDITYYIDINALDKAISPDADLPLKQITDTEVKTVTNEEGITIGTEVTTNTYNIGKEINVAKYDILRMCLETIIDYSEELDETLGSERALDKAPLSYKLAFNTLLNEGIIKEKE